MFDIYQNTLCVEAKWLYEDNRIMSLSYYSDLVRKKTLHRVNGRGCRGKKVLIAYESVPANYRDKIRKVLKGKDPKELVHFINFRDYIKPDYKSEEFYRDYVLENDEKLPEDKQLEYVHNARILNACHDITTNVITCRKFGGKIRSWKAIAKAITNLPTHTYKHNLPENYRLLREKCDAYTGKKLTKRYAIAGYEGLIHGNFVNKSAQKLNEDACKWALARWANQVNKCANLAQLHHEYNELAEQKGWKHIKEEKTFYNFIYDEEIQPLWYGHRHGELAAKEKFMFQHKTKMPSFRDSLWFSDGTKLNYYFLNEEGEVKTCQVYEVMDAYSEVFIGYHISPTEDYKAQYAAYKMAVQTAGYRPYQLKYDNQGGHGKLKSGEFLSKIARIQTATQPYNGKSKTIESAFGRFQQQFLKRDWFFTGQNITAKKQESKANMEFILANKANIPSLQEVKEIYAQRRKEWNSAPHHKTGRPRIDMYFESKNPDTKKVEVWDMIDLFWITREKPTNIDAAGISFTEKKVKYDFMVYNEDGLPNLAWLSKNIGKKVVIKFDPEDMSEIRLFEDTAMGLRYITAATTKVEVSRGMQEQDEFEASHIRQVINNIKEVRVSTRDEMETILEAHGMTAQQQGLNKPNLKGLERSKKGRKKKAEGEIGQYTKAISNQDWDDEIDMYQEVAVKIER